MAARLVLLPFLLAFVLASAAFGAAARGGATYSGTLVGPGHIAITLRVSADGHAVVGVKLAHLPIYCSGNGPPGAPTVSFPRATISAAGKFRANGKDMIGSGPLKGSVAATFHLSGTFAAGGREHGVLATSYGGAARSCSGTSAYSTRASR